MAARISRKISLAAAVGAVVFVTAVFKEIAVIHATTVRLAYLITILLVAASWEFAECVVASIVATICFSYFFLPPVGAWAIADPENWVALFAFLVSSLIASDLSNRARRRTAEANARKMEMERLYALSRAILAMESNQPIGDRIASELARICEIPAVAIYDRTSDLVHRSGLGELPEVEARLRQIAQTGSPSKDDRTGTIFAPINLGGNSIGSIAIRGAELSNTALHALLNLIA